jgi:hypothetical protein
MRRMFGALMLFVVSAAIVGCGGGNSAPTPTTPGVDNRATEVKQTDDMMQKALKKK